MRTECNFHSAKKGWPNESILTTFLFDLHNDPAEEKPLSCAKTEKMMKEKLIEAMKESDAPQEQYERFGLNLV